MTADATVTASPKKASRWPPVSFCSISASAGLWQTRFLTIDHRKLGSRLPRSKSPITKPMRPFRGSLIWLPPERLLRDKCSDYIGYCIGQVCHKGVVYPGEQPAIVDRVLWER